MLHDFWKMNDTQLEETQLGRKVMHLWMGRGNVINERPESAFTTVIFPGSDYPSDVLKTDLLDIKENT